MDMASEPREAGIQPLLRAALIVLVAVGGALVGMLVGLVIADASGRDAEISALRLVLPAALGLALGVTAGASLAALLGLLRQSTTASRLGPVILVSSLAVVTALAKWSLARYVSFDPDLLGVSLLIPLSVCLGGALIATGLCLDRRHDGPVVGAGILVSAVSFVVGLASLGGLVSGVSTAGVLVAIAYVIWLAAQLVAARHVRTGPAVREPSFAGHRFTGSGDRPAEPSAADAWSAIVWLPVALAGMVLCLFLVVPGIPGIVVTAIWLGILTAYRWIASVPEDRGGRLVIDGVFIAVCLVLGSFGGWYLLPAATLWSVFDAARRPHAADQATPDRWTSTA